jgi:AcrR family transcriptional regulator
MAVAFPQLFDRDDAGGLPARPDEAIWPYLDAAARCIERFGWSRTSVRDVAAEAGVERTTVYRRVGSMDDIFRLLLAREAHLLVESLPRSLPAGADGPEIAVELLAAAVEHCLAHPVFHKIVVDEPDVAGAFLTRSFPELITRISVALAPTLDAAMDLGFFARRDPLVLGEWIVRVGISLLLAPPPVDVRRFLTEVLDPVLRPGVGGDAAP